MGFYQELSHFYDAIFAVDTAEMQFIATQLHGCTHILDIGCGTGNKTIHFVREDNQITGIDLDAGMIATAKAKHAHSNIQYNVQNMQEIAKHFAPEHFNGILCLGNTLVHLPSVASMQEMLHTTYALLQKEGLFIAQILNYDRIIAANISSLPLIETEDVQFTRCYSWDAGKLHFVTSLTNKQTGQVFKNDIVLYPLRKAELESMLHQTGFSQTQYFGDYQGGSHTADSFVTIVVAKKE